MKVLDNINNYRISLEIDEEPNEDALLNFGFSHPTIYLFEEL